MREQKIWEFMRTDILIVGGGFGGFWAAIKAAEDGAAVTLVDKAYAGKGGHSFLAGGAMQALLPEDDLDEYVADVARGNDWLVDQKKVEAIFRGSYDRLKDLESFGINFRKNNDGYIWTKARGTKNVKNIWPEHAIGADIVSVLRRAAITRGVHVLNHIYIYDLLKGKTGKIAGAVGVGLKDSKDYIFNAKAVILATNSGGFRGHHLGSELQGTGPFMAYEAGAKIRNPEFHYINIRPVKHEVEGSGILPAIGARWINGKGEFFMEKYDPVLKDRSHTGRIVVGAAKEALLGNTPVTINVEGMTEEERERFKLLMVSHGWMPILVDKCRRREGYDILHDNIEWQPAYESNKMGIDADLNCRSSLEGVYAAGMARTLGINPFTGWSIASSTWSGFTAGESAGAYSREVDWEDIDFSSASRRKESFFAPLKNEKGTKADEVVYQLQKTLFPADVLIIMSDPKLQTALEDVTAIKDEMVPSLEAGDIRTLVKVKEARTMVLAAEMSLRAALMRKETRPNIFYREDYPSCDNTNWLKWIIVEKGSDEKMNFFTRDIPFSEYKFKPQEIKA